MDLFVRAELPETCYIHEAALWISLGIVPKFYPHDDGEDVRGFVDEHLDHMEAVISAELYDTIPVIDIAFTVFWGAMAFAIMGGLAVASVLTLLVLPVLYDLVFNRGSQLE